REGSRTVGQLILRFRSGPVGRISGDDRLEVSTGFVILAEHHHRHRHVVASEEMVRAKRNSALQGRQRTVEVTFETLNQTDLPQRIAVVRLYGEDLLQFNAGLRVLAVAPQIESSLIVRS